MKLQLQRPIAFIDLETTGVNVASDRIVEYSIIKINPGGEREILTERLNPTVPIPKECSAIHGIYDADVKDAPTFASRAKAIAAFLKNCDFGGYNSNKFDIPLLVEEFLRADVDFDMKGRKLIDVQNIFHMMEQRTLAAAYKFYCQKDLENAHSAEADIMATFDILEAQLDRYPQLQNNVDFLSEFSCRSNNVDMMGRIVLNKNGVEVFNFGKHKDKAVEEIFMKEPSYYDWMMNGDFPLHTKKVITAIRLRKFNKV